MAEGPPSWEILSTPREGPAAEHFDLSPRTSPKRRADNENMEDDSQDKRLRPRSPTVSCHTDANSNGMEDGTLDASRLDSYRSLRKELAYLERRQDQNAQQVEKKKWREIHKELRRSTKYRPKK